MIIPLPKLVKTQKTTAIYQFFFCTSELEMMQDIHRWSADTSMASPEDMIDQDGSVTLEALSKATSFAALFFL